MSWRRDRDWDGGRSVEVSRMWGQRQVAKLDIKELSEEVGIPSRVWWGIESGELVARPKLLSKMRAVTRRRYLEVRRHG